MRRRTALTKWGALFIVCFFIYSAATADGVGAERARAATPSITPEAEQVAQLDEASEAVSASGETDRNLAEQRARASDDHDAARLDAAVAMSDDYAVYSEVFDTASRSLINLYGATIDDLVENGGWVRSQTHKPKPVYFTYIGAYRRIYFNAVTLEFFE